MVFEHYYWVVGADIGLVENEGLLFGCRPLVVLFFVFVKLLLEHAHGLEHHLTLLVPLLLLATERLQSSLELGVRTLH